MGKIINFRKVKNAGLKSFSWGCLFMKQHLLSRISKLASFLLASASRATPSAPSCGDRRVSVLLLGLGSSGGTGGQHVWSVRDESTWKTPVHPVLRRSRLCVFYLVAVILGMEIFVRNVCGEDLHGCCHTAPSHLPSPG